MNFDRPGIYALVALCYILSFAHCFYIVRVENRRDAAQVEGKPRA